MGLSPGCSTSPVRDGFSAAATHSVRGLHAMNLITTLAGSMMEGYFPRGWDLARIDRLGALSAGELTRRASWWHPQFEPVGCASLADFDTVMGHEIAREIQLAR